VGTFSMAAGAKFVLDGTPWIFDDEETPWGETVWGDYLYEIRSFLGVTLTDAEIDFTETFEDFDYAPFDPTGTYNKAQLNELIEAYILYYIITDQGFTSFATTDELAQYLQSSDDATANLTINLTGVSTFDILGAEITVVGLDGRYATTVFTVYSGSLTVTDSVVTAAAPFALADSEGRLNLVNTVLLIDGDGVVVFDATNTTLNGVTLVVPTTSTAMQPTAGHAAIDAYAPIVLFGGKEYKAWSVNKASNENASVTGAVAIYADTAAAETSGIRFSSTVSQDVITALTAGGKTLKYGTLVAPADYVAKAKSFTPAALDAVIDGTAYVKIPAVYSLVTGAEGVSFSGILVNLKSNTRVYAAVSYIEVYEGNELVDTIYSAYDAQFNAKSAEQLADAITLSDKYATLEAGQKAIVDAYANGKVEVVIPDPAA